MAAICNLITFTNHLFLLVYVCAMCVRAVYMCMRHVWVGTIGGQERALDTPLLELQTVVSYYICF